MGKAKRMPVGDKLFLDMMEWRTLLAKQYHTQNKLEYEELDESIFACKTSAVHSDTDILVRRTTHHKTP